jgi:hypothetical protein
VFLLLFSAAHGFIILLFVMNMEVIRLHPCYHVSELDPSLQVNFKFSLSVSGDYFGCCPPFPSATRFRNWIYFSHMSRRKGSSGLGRDYPQSPCIDIKRFVELRAVISLNSINPFVFVAEM